VNKLSKKSKQVLTALFLILDGVIVYAILVPVFATSHDRGNVSVVSNMKQLGLGALMYSNDYDEKLPFYDPFEFGNLSPLDPYFKYSFSYSIPSLHSGTKSNGTSSDFQFHYVLNRFTFYEGNATRLILDRAKLGDDGAKTPLMSSPALKIRDKWYRCIGYADSHVKASPAENVINVPPVPADLPELPFQGNYLIQVGGFQKEPPFWAVPYADVIALQELAKENSRKAR